MGTGMRLTPNIRYGTELYTEQVARRLRALNITVWVGAAVVIFFGLLRLLDRTTPFSWQLAVANLSTALILALLPLLHRFSPVAAPFILAILGDASYFSSASGLAPAPGSFFITRT